jgi:hypothetical protein
VILFANGNSGEQGASTMTSQASAKNVIGVGASESTFNSQSIENIAYFSSQGPTYDGRWASHCGHLTGATFVLVLCFSCEYDNMTYC